MSSRRSERSSRAASPISSLALGLVWLLLVGATTLTGCQTPEPGPTPTATRTPILPTPTPTLTPTSTPLPTSTPTPTPTPTLPPELILPANATVADVCPPLPVDLYYIREGALGACLAESRAMLEIPVADQAVGRTIRDYRVSSDQTRIVYLTDAGELYVLDRALLTHTFLPTAGTVIGAGGLYFDITPDGATIIYLGWGVQAGAGPAIEGASSAALLAISANDPRQLQQHLGSCEGSTGLPCQGFLMAPDGSKLAVLDERGIWRIDRDAPDTARLLAYRANDQVALSLRSWSPDGQSLAIDLSPDGGPALIALTIEADDVALAPSALCTAPCEIGSTWAVSESEPAQLWVTWDTQELGCYGRMPETLAADQYEAIQPENVTCGTPDLPLHPRSPLAGSPFVPVGTDLAFLQASGPGLYGGIYAVDRSTSPDQMPHLSVMALIPDDLASRGRLLWTRDGSAFIHVLDTGQAMLLGIVQDPALWDVSDLLKGATHFTWADTRR